MNKNTGIIIGVIALLMVGGIYFLTGQTDDSKMTAGTMEAPAMMEQNEPTMINGDESVKGDKMIKVGSYETYAPEKLSKAVDGSVVLFFRASWCPTCKAIDADIRANLEKIPAGLAILDVDYDHAGDLKKKYLVAYQHTFVQVNQKGDMIKKWSMSPTLAALIAEVILK